MPLKGRDLQVLLEPRHLTDVAPFETIVPAHSVLANGHTTLLGNWERRPGMELAHTLASPYPVTLLIPVGPGYAVTRDGHVYRLDNAERITTPTEKLCGVARPTWTFFDQNVIIADGAHPLGINKASRALRLPGYPPRAHHVTTLDSFLLLTRLASPRIRWSVVESFVTWPFENRNEVASDGEAIQMSRVLDRRLYLWKDRSLEIWVHTAGNFTFQRQTRLDRGTPAGASVVECNNRFYFYGDDGDFQQLVPGAGPVVISTAIRGRLDELRHPASCYGIEFCREHVIRWFFPDDGRVFTFDRRTERFFEDEGWREGTPALVPAASYMEHQGEAFIGDAAPTGRIYRWTEASAVDILDDVTAPIRMPRRFRISLSEGGRRTRVNRLRLRVLRGAGDDDQRRALATLRRGVLGDARAMLVRVAFDEGDVVTHQIDLGAVGDRFPFVDLYSLGTGHQLELELVMAEPAIAYRATDALLTVEPVGP